MTMRSVLVVLLLLFVTSCSRHHAGQQGNSLGPYGVKSGVIAFQTAVSLSTRKLYFDDYGAKQARYDDFTMNLGGRSITNTKIRIRQNGDLIEFSPSTKQGVRYKPAAGGIGDGISDITEADIQRMLDGDSQGAVIQTIPGRSVAGQDTNGYSLDKNGKLRRVWFWKGILVCIESIDNNDPKDARMGPWITLMATSIDEGPVDSDKFAVPNDLRLTEK